MGPVTGTGPGIGFTGETFDGYRFGFTHDVGSGQKHKLILCLPDGDGAANTLFDSIRNSPGPLDQLIDMRLRKVGAAGGCR